MRLYKLYGGGLVGEIDVGFVDDDETLVDWGICELEDVGDGDCFAGWVSGAADEH